MIKTIKRKIVNSINPVYLVDSICGSGKSHRLIGNDSNLLIVFYVQIMPDDFVMQLHRF
ncbi:TRAP transporter subunit DctM [Escherichia coli]|nr:TRAP transporter subunit DctM [Escherichia coli]